MLNKSKKMSLHKIYLKYEYRELKTKYNNYMSFY